MITIQVDRSKDKFSILITGHAGYAEEGKDIVCAAVSILANTLLWNLEKIQAPRYVESCSEGKYNFTAYGEDAVRVLEVILVGLRETAKECYEHVELKENNF